MASKQMNSLQVGEIADIADNSVPRAMAPIPLPVLRSNPLVSVIITNYNYAAFLGRAIASVIEQTYPNFEIVVCDDGSTDESVQVLSDWANRDSRVIFFSQANSGQVAAFTSSYRRCAGDIICLLDSDDYFEPSKLEKVVRRFSSDASCGVVIHDIRVIRSDGETIRRLTYPREGLLGVLCNRLSVDNPYPSCSGLSFRRHVIDEVLPLPEGFRLGVDGLLSSTAAYLTITRSIPEPLAAWRIHGENGFGSVTASTELNPDWLRRRLQLVERTIAYEHAFVTKRFGTTFPVLAFRPILEYRLVLAIMSGATIESIKSVRGLWKAYLAAKLDYPLHRLLFFSLLPILPRSLAVFAIRRALRRYQQTRSRSDS